MKYDKKQHIIFEIEYQPDRIVPVHCYGEEQAFILLYGDEWGPSVEAVSYVQM